MDKLSEAYFTKFKVRVEVLPEYAKRKSYSDVIREGQEALELFLKGLLRSMGVEPTFSHDPGKELQNYLQKIPVEFKALGPDLVQWSKKLRKERELSFYGAVDFIPTQEYSAAEAKEVIQFLEAVKEKMEAFLKAR